MTKIHPWTKKNESIHDLELPEKDYDAGIRYGQTYVEWEACIAANLDVDKWEKGEYSDERKAEVLAFYDAKTRIRVFVEEAAKKHARYKEMRNTRKR